MKLIKVTGDTSELVLNLAHPIMLDESEKYKVGLVGLYSYNNVYNVCKDCSFYFHFYGKDKSTKVRTVVIKGGYWTLKEIESLVRKELAIVNSAQEFRPNEFTIVLKKDRIKITSPLLLELDNHLCDLFGISKKSFLTTTGTSTPKLRPFDTLEIHCNLVESSYSNHSSYAHAHEESQLLYSFFPNAPFGYKINEKPQNILYVPLTDHLRKIDSIKISIKNENGDVIDNGKTKTTIYLCLIRD